MRRFAAAVFIFLFLCGGVFSAAAGGEYLNSRPLSGWLGGKAARLGSESVLYIEGGGSVYTDFEASDALSVYIYCDAGNYPAAGGGSLKAQYLSDGGAVLAESEVTVPDDGSFRRFCLGSETMQAGLPEDTAKIRLYLTCSGGSGPYFRDLNVVMSDMSARDMSVSQWTVSGKLGAVQVKSSASDYILGVIFVFLAAAIMLGVRKYLDKLKERK